MADDAAQRRCAFRSGMGAAPRKLISAWNWAPDPRARRLLAWAWLAAGGFLLALGARELLMPVLGQREIGRQWESPQSESLKIPRAPIAPAPVLGATVCRLLIPRLGADLFVVEGTDQQDLRIGPGHMQGSTPPGGTATASSPAIAIRTPSVPRRRHQCCQRRLNFRPRRARTRTSPSASSAAS